MPALPARAASMVALSANKFVCSAIWVMTFTTSPISTLLCPSLLIHWLAPVTDCTDRLATEAASLALEAISRTLALRFTTPVAIV